MAGTPAPGRRLMSAGFPETEGGHHREVALDTAAAGPVVPEPSRRLARGARPLWTLEAVLAAVPVLLVASVATVILRNAEWAESAPSGVVPLLWTAVAVVLAVRILVVPQLRWRQWRYEVRESEIDMRRGAFTVRRTLVPMSRVQHVDTRRTVLSQLFGLAAVVFHTAAGANEIPALSERDAAGIRDRIADLAATSEDPV